MKTQLWRRIVSLALCLALLLVYLPAAVSAAASDRVADPSTMDGWKEIFLPDTLNTENAGKVWTDKSVFTDAAAFDGTGITQDDPNSFLVAMSAMASNMSVTGLSNTPTDTMMILDLSSSMYGGYDRDPSTVRTMLSAVNDSIEKLQNLNRNNRVGVVIYYGGKDRNQSDATNSMVLLPLDRYTGTTTYLKADVSGGRLISVAVNSGLKNSAGETVPQKTHTVADVAGTYAQLGILDAMEQLLAADTVIPATAAYQPNAVRVPVMIFMSDGEPTAATHRYTQKVAAGMGNNTVSIRSPNETDFVTQLTAAYAREKVDAHYVRTEPLFYTLSLGTSVSLAVMDPANHTPGTVDSYWDRLLSNGSADITVYNSPDGWSAPTVKKTYTVSKTTVNGTAFPTDKAQRSYVDKAFTAENANDLTSAFGDIVEQISIVSEFSPTLVADNADVSGYISFVDKIGHYMKVTDIKGILIDNTLYSGAELSRNFVTGGGDLGTHDAPTELGAEMVWAVKTRLGLESEDAARTLISLAYEHGQLSYTDPTEYSNYIGWYANAAGEFLGFWHEGISTMPEATGDAATDPAFIIKSYGYLGKVDENQGVAASDMMYATVQVRESIATGEQTVAFAVPAALIPILTYEVKLDKQNHPQDLTVSGAGHPIRLVYEVALDEAIDAYHVMERVSEEYLAANTDPEGNIRFYSNQYEADLSTGYNKVNAYSYFNPSRQNSRYYYLEDTPVCTDTQGTLYTGEAQPSGTYYRGYTVYEKVGTQVTQKTLYRRISDAALATARRTDGGSWYIGAGNVHVNLEGYTVTKTENTTDTMPDAYIPFVDAHNHSVGDLGYSFIVGATLGNNGSIALKPETGIILTKTMAQGTAAPSQAFGFVITNLSDGADEGTYPALVCHADGTESTIAVRFSAGRAGVSLQAGESLRIGGMKPGTVYTVEEVPTLEYVPNVDTVEVTMERGKMTPVSFINADRGTGSLTVSKEVVHALGSDHRLPEQLRFDLRVTLTGLGVANAAFDAVSTDGSVSTVTTDADGSFTVTLGHDEQLEIFGLPAGTVASVTEPEPGDGFTPSYWEDGEPGDGVVTVQADAVASVAVVNRYEARQVAPVNLVLNGRKNLNTAAADWNGAVFTFQLQRWQNETWHTVATATASESSPTFDFNDAMQAERFTAPGTYYYQVLEEGGGQTLNGITYDGTLHTFGIAVADRDMDGQLEIDRVVSYHTGREFDRNPQGQWQIDIVFNNAYEATGTQLVLDVRKKLINESASPLVSLSGFQFGLYEEESLVAASELTDGVGEARFLLHYELEDAGIHTYVLRELVPREPVPGMSYSTAAATVEVEVTDNGDGTMSAAVLRIDGQTENGVPVFTNSYKPLSARLELDFVDKKLTGRAMEPGEFRFELRAADGTAAVEGTNDAAGNVIFEDKLYFDRVGTWFYDLAETGTDGNGITLDKTVYNLVVTVTDEQGVLTAKHHVLNVVGEHILFENSYTAAETSYTISGEKRLEGRMLLNEEFTFVLTDANGEVIDEAVNFTDGHFSFAPITYTQPGSYRYTVSERSGDTAYGVTYDTTEYQVTVTVTDNLEGQLEVSRVAVAGGSGEEIVFINRYTAAPTCAAIDGTKILTGRVLGRGDFRFELYEADEDWGQGQLLQTVENGADGSFAFDAMAYDAPGLYRYLIREKDGGQAIDGVTYDATVYRVTVEITDDAMGQLHGAVSLCDSGNTYRQSVEFVNTYAVTGQAQVILEGTKTLRGMELEDGAFTFRLFPADEAFEATGEVLQTAVNEDGGFRFSLSYGPEDVGNTYRYLVMEKNAGQTVDRITYSDARYWVTVVVEDNGTGGIRTVTSITDGLSGQSVSGMAFENIFTPEPEAVEVEIRVNKTVENTGTETIGPEGFEFLLENKTTGGTRSVKSDAAGRAAFTLRFTEADIGKCYTYQLSEVDSGRPNVVYSKLIYRITVTVALNEDNELVTTVTNNGTEVTQAVAAFKNLYEYTPPQDPPTGEKPPQDPPAEEKPPQTPIPEIPKTGDMGLTLWLVMLALSCGAVISLSAFEKKHSK